MRFLSKHGTRRRILKGGEDGSQLNLLIDQWFSSPLGATVLRAQKAKIEPFITRNFGYHILQLGCSETHSLIQESPVGHKILFSPTYHGNVKQAVASNEELPLADDVIDVVLIHHALDFTEDSHKLLREATRVLRPGGRLIILGFNPYSNWGVCRLLNRRAGIPWCGRYISSRRIIDWLKLLQLQLDDLSYNLHFMPLPYSKLLKYTQAVEDWGNKFRSPLGGAYCIVSTKQVQPLTPVSPRWRPLRARAAVMPVTERVRVEVD